MADNDYVLGHSGRELARLQKQAGFYAEATRDGLRKAGLRPGMRVLDLGCGVGDVSLIAAELVGPSGSATGIDISADATAVAGQRAAAAGANASFETGRIEDFARFADFDAVVSRFVLVHFPDPAALLRAVADKARRGALLISMEMDMGTASVTAPVLLFERHLDQIRLMYATMGLSPDMGARLHASYRAAGLAPRLAGFTRVGDASETEGLEFFAESVRSLMPMLDRLGIATAADIDIETLSTRLAVEAARTDPAIFYPRFVVAWATL